MMGFFWVAIFHPRKREQLRPVEIMFMDESRELEMEGLASG